MGYEDGLRSLRRDELLTNAQDPFVPQRLPPGSYARYLLLEPVDTGRARGLTWQNHDHPILKAGLVSVPSTYPHVLMEWRRRLDPDESGPCVVRIAVRGTVTGELFLHRRIDPWMLTTAPPCLTAEEIGRAFRLLRTVRPFPDVWSLTRNC